MILKQITMMRYKYTIEEMIQFIAEYDKGNQIIAEYKEAEDIETITEEDIMNLFGDTYLTYNIYYVGPYYWSGSDYVFISDYDQYLIDKGYDPISEDFLDELNRIDYRIIPTVDTVQLCDVENEDWSNFSCTLEELISSNGIDERVIRWLGVPRIPGLI